MKAKHGVRLDSPKEWPIQKKVMPLVIKQDATVDMGTKYQGPGEKSGAEPTWRDRKRYLWLLAPVVPALVAESWFLVQVTGLDVFWWFGPMLTFTVIPLLDHFVGADAENPPDSAPPYWAPNPPLENSALFSM